MFTHSETELTTAATDALLGVLCVALAWQLAEIRSVSSWTRHVWLGVLLFMGIGSLLGAIVHGIELGAGVRAVLWKPLYLSLGMTVALVAVCAISDWLGEPAGRRVLPWAVGVGFAFFAVTQLRSGSFVIFLAYEGAAMLGAFFVYAMLAHRGMVGAEMIAGGIAISLLAALVQASAVSLQLVVRFDHNGLFHLLQMVGIIVVSMGVRASLLAPWP